MTQSIRDAEIEAGKILNSELDQHLDLAMKAFGLAGKVLSAIQQARVKDILIVKVAINLLVRLPNDLRSVSILAMMGYHTQAAVWSLRCMKRLTILFINSDNALADQWINHQEPTRPFHNVWEMTKTGSEHGL